MLAIAARRHRGARYRPHRAGLGRPPRRAESLSRRRFRAPGWLVPLHRDTRVRGPERVLLRYWCNQELLAAHEIATGNPGLIGGGVATGPCVVISAAADGQGGYRDHFIGDIDSLTILDHAITEEHVETLCRRLTFWQPEIARAHRDLLPPGTRPSRDPDSNAQRLLKATAQATALAESMVEDFEQNSLPPRCYGARLAQWENCLALPRPPNLPIATRRARAQAALRRELGFTANALRQGLAPLLGVEPERVELITASNLIEDRFERRSLERLLWRKEGNGLATSLLGRLILISWPGFDIRFDGAIRNALFCKAPLCNAAPATFIARLVWLYNQGLPPNTEAGIFLGNGRDIVWWAVRRIGDTHALGYRTFKRCSSRPGRKAQTRSPCRCGSACRRMASASQPATAQRAPTRATPRRSSSRRPPSSPGVASLCAATKARSHATRWPTSMKP